MVRHIFAFFREAPGMLTSEDDAITLGEYLEDNRYSREFIEWHMLPMASALWSTPAARVRNFPVLHVIRFLDHHRMLAVSGRPVWKTVRGGSQRYVEALTRGFENRIRLCTAVRAVRRTPNGVMIMAEGGDAERFDEVVLAAHADQTLRILGDADELERMVLEAFPYQRNEAVLHTDHSILPRNRRAWASWNYYVPVEDRPEVSVTYYQNRLQAIDSGIDYCVSLNPGLGFDGRRVLERFTYEHPTFACGALSMQKRHRELIRRNRTSFAGAYWGFGFHEDGVNSALAVADAFGETL
jgi:predicted NAD/FAD-binding protein